MGTLPGRVACVALLIWLNAPAVYANTTDVVVADDAIEDVTPESLIQDMSNALKNLNYEGSFVYVREDNVESMSIVHSNGDSGELEYMLSLNGEAREVLRNNSSVICLWPNSDSVIVSDSKQRRILPKIDASLTNSDLYQLSIGESDRVAGRAVHLVEITPKDHYRYGHRFWIDQQTKMLLRSMLLDNQDNPVEQVMFTTISYPDSIPASRFDGPGKRMAAFTENGYAKAMVDDGQNRVDFDSLPVGYSEVAETYQPMPINDAPVTHVMLSDGMASVSVYVEYIKQADQVDAGLGMSMMGAMNAYTRSLDTALVTVVGEVPPATVEAIALSVRLIE